MSLNRRFSDLHLCVAIPVYNHAGTVRQVISAVREQCDEVIVVNDGSTDSTSEVLQAIENEIILISYTPNRGKGFALKAAFREARKRGFDYVITMDGDGQHTADDLCAFADAIAQHPDSLLIGSREMNHPNMPSQNTFANKFSNFWLMLQTAHRLPDTQSGYRLYPLRKMEKIHWFTNRYETELEILVRSAWRGISLIPVPIHVYYPPQNEHVSHFRPCMDFFRISLLNTTLCLMAVLYGYPSMFFRKIFKSHR